MTAGFVLAVIAYIVVLNAPTGWVGCHEVTEWNRKRKKGLIDGWGDPLKGKE
jgi:hypothetical protein